VYLITEDGQFSRNMQRVLTGLTKFVVDGGETYVSFYVMYRDADKSFARPGRKQATATEDSEFHISCL
jgi:hypothetical protein